ncbi:hypothetical protein KVR01_013533 [Diaporthe batatas]|uniref:uncharacterized protein n=1 Tax=Diaporthe batatas TaxID=748121 RepID=UPI001D05786E|nr:uncharacterized protein KVR01_013533 [Diaporthe batatas]KAG8156582.1 hypothetical protein KVR01_013533 [Diaporthe batatas]
MPNQQHRQGSGQLNKSTQVVRTATTSSNNETQKAIIICGFAAIGKSTFLGSGSYNGYTVDDLDSSGFSKEPEWPKNYLDEIKKKRYQKTILMISTHKAVYTQLLKEGVDLILVYPKRELRSEWEARIKGRENRLTKKPSVSMWDGVGPNWDKWINEYEQQKCPRYEMSQAFQTGSRSSK